VLRIGKPDARLVASGDSGAPAGAVVPTSGTDFLQAKARTRRDSAARSQRVKEDAAGAYEALEQLADAAKIRPVDPQGMLLLDAAFLVPPARIDAMHETLTRRAARLLQDGCAVTLSGPWPPYSFASVEPGDE
jgi:hypothetical protein